MIKSKLIGFALLVGAATASQAAVYTVSKYTDDGSAGTLRSAINLSNANPSPGGNTIQILTVGLPPYVIKLNSLLPPIKGPAIVKGLVKGAANPGPSSIAIDGSNFIDGNNQASCPGTTAGFGPNVRSVFGPALAVVDSGNVEISNLEIRSFCIGILSLRSHDNHFHHNYIHNMAGAAGINVTGDDGIGNGGNTVGLSTRNLIDYNVLADVGDGMECTRGTSFSTYQYNVMSDSRTRANVAYSQGIECAGGLNDNNVIQYNTITGFSDGLQMNSASNLQIIGNTITGSTYGITTGGAQVTITGNTISGNRMGVGPTASAAVRVKITQNKIYNNGQPIVSRSDSAGGTTNPASPALLGIDLGVNGVSADDQAVSCGDGFPDCAQPQNFPLLSSASLWSVSGVNLTGTLPSRPNANFTLEFFANHSLNPAGFGEGEVYLGTINVTTGPTGNVSFNFPTGANPLGDGSTTAYFTVTATNSSGQTSEFSPALQLTKSTANPVDFSGFPGNDWPTYGGNWANDHYSTLSQVNTNNVGTLGGAWVTHLEGGATTSGQASSAVVINGTIYVQTIQNNVFAINGATGAVKWKYTSGAGNFNLRGVAVAEGKVFSTLNGRRIVALDENTGAVVWGPITITDATYPGGSFPAPLVYYNGLVYVGTGGGDGAYRGRGYALRASDGSIAWTFWGTPATGELGNNTWAGTSWTTGGSAPWIQPAVDPQLGLVYWTFGNAFSNEDGRNRAGDNLYSGSIVAMDAMTGQYRWHFQMVHHDLWDYDMGHPILMDIPMGGQTAKAVAVPGKTGYVYIFDRANGRPLIGINEMPVGQNAINHTAATQPFPVGDAFSPICPGQNDPTANQASRAVPNYGAGCIFVPFEDLKAQLQPNGTGGGADIGASAFSPKTGLLYVPAGLVNSAFSISQRFFRPLGEYRAGTLTAMDPKTNKIVWQKATPWALGHENVLATAGDLLFLGYPDGNLLALDLNSQGSELWRFQTGAGLGVANMITYAINGVQYVAVLSGGQGLEYNTTGGDSLWAFKLGGSVPQAATPPAPSVRQPINAAAVAGSTVANTVRLSQTSATSAESNSQNAMFPQNMTVPVGTTVTFLNAATNTQPHCATQFFEGLYNVGPLAPGQSATYTFTQAGEYFYNDCTNPQTTGKIVVQ